MSSDTVYWVFSEGSVASCAGLTSSYAFPSRVCNDRVCALGSLETDAAVAVNGSFYGVVGRALCDGKEHVANLARTATSGLVDVGTYACTVGNAPWVVPAPWNQVQTLGLEVGSRRCDILFYRNDLATPCTEMLGCHSSQTNCVSYLGHQYTCDGTVRSNGQDIADYACSCKSQLRNPPRSAGNFTFAGETPKSGGCGLPLLAAPPREASAAFSQPATFSTSPAMSMLKSTSTPQVSSETLATLSGSSLLVPGGTSGSSSAAASSTLSLLSSLATTASPSSVVLPQTTATMDLSVSMTSGVPEVTGTSSSSMLSISSSSTTASSSTPASVFSESGANNGLPTGAKAGIGAGIGVGVLAAVLLVFLARRNGRRKRESLEHDFRQPARTPYYAL